MDRNRPYLILLAAFFFLFFFLKGAQGSTNDCEKKALAYQERYGGDLIYLNPIDSNGAWQLCRYCGHWLVLRKDRMYYDPQFDTEIGYTAQDVRDWWKQIKGTDSQIWNISAGEHPPFSLIRG